MSGSAKVERSSQGRVAVFRLGHTVLFSLCVCVVLVYETNCFTVIYPPPHHHHILVTLMTSLPWRNESVQKKGEIIGQSEWVFSAWKYWIQFSAGVASDTVIPLFYSRAGDIWMLENNFFWNGLGVTSPNLYTWMTMFKFNCSSWCSLVAGTARSHLSIPIPRSLFTITLLVLFGE